VTAADQLARMQELHHARPANDKEARLFDQHQAEMSELRAGRGWASRADRDRQVCDFCARTGVGNQRWGYLAPWPCGPLSLARQLAGAAG
jgi:hypothetical protein